MIKDKGWQGFIYRSKNDEQIESDDDKDKKSNSLNL